MAMAVSTQPHHPPFGSRRLALAAYILSCFATLVGCRSQTSKRIMIRFILCFSIITFDNVTCMFVSGTLKRPSSAFSAALARPSSAARRPLERHLRAPSAPLEGPFSAARGPLQRRSSAPSAPLERRSSGARALNTVEVHVLESFFLK